GPGCRFHSRARGGEPVNDQQRMSPWAIHRWLTALAVCFLLVEIVPEYVDFGPLDPKTRKPIKAKKGLYFQAWVEAIWKMGYAFEWRFLNAADYGGAPTPPPRLR